MLAVLRQRDFALLWFAGLISLTGDWMLLVALPITVYELTGSALATAGLVIASRVPSLILGSVAGVFVDRWDRKRTMVIVNLLRAPVLLLLLFVDSADRVWIVYIVAFVVAALGQFFSPAENALLPQLVAKQHLIPANALNGLNNNLSRLVGPAVGGVIAGWYGLSGITVVDAATYLIAGAMIAAITHPAQPASSTQPDDIVVSRWASLWRDWRAGLRVISNSRTLCVVFGVVAISSLGEGIISAAFPAFVKDALNGGAQEIGWLLSAQAAGGLIGAAVIGAWAKALTPTRLLAWGAIGIGTFDLLIFNYPRLISGVWPGIVLFVIVGIPVTAFMTGFTTTIQTEVKDAFRGRVFGAANTTMALLMIVGAIIAGAATDRLGPITVLTIDSITYIIAGVVALKLLGTAVSRRVNADQPSVP